MYFNFFIVADICPKLLKKNVHVAFSESQPYLPSSMFIPFGARESSLRIHFFSIMFRRFLALSLSGWAYIKSIIYTFISCLPLCPFVLK